MIFADFCDDGVDFFEVGIFAAGALGGIGEHGDFGLFPVVGLESFGGIFDDAVEFVGVGEFVDATVGEDKMLAFPLANEATGEKLRL